VQQHVQTLPRLVPAHEHDRVLAPIQLGRLGEQDAVRNDLVVPREPARSGDAGLLGDGDPVVEPVEQESPRRLGEPEPAELARGMERADERRASHRQRPRADHRGHRLVQVEDVEAVRGEDAAQPHDRPRAQDDVRQRSVRRHDDRAADRYDVVRRRLVPAGAGMQHPRERPRGIVTAQDPGVVAELDQRPRLMIRVLDHAAPERP
jgi:hypothetical protein